MTDTIDLIIVAPQPWDGVESLDTYLQGLWAQMSGRWERLAQWGSCAVVMEDACGERGPQGVPWRFAVGCIDGLADPEGVGWVMVNEIVWVRDDWDQDDCGASESGGGRLRDSHEQMFVLAKSSEWYGDAYAVTTPYRGKPRRNLSGRQRGAIQPGQRGQRLSVEPQAELGIEGANGLGRVLGDVCRADGRELVRQLRATFLPEVCTKCGAPRRRTLGRRCLGCGAVIPRQRHACPQCGGRERSRQVVDGRACLCDNTSAPTRPGRVQIDAALCEHETTTATTGGPPAPRRLAGM